MLSRNTFPVGRKPSPWRNWRTILRSVTKPGKIATLNCDYSRASKDGLFPPRDGEMIAVLATRSEGAMGTQILIWWDCSAEFPFPPGEQELFAAQNFVPPVRCRTCREDRRKGKDVATQQKIKQRSARLVSGGKE